MSPLRLRMQAALDELSYCDFAAASGVKSRNRNRPVPCAGFPDASIMPTQDYISGRTAGLHPFMRRFLDLDPGNGDPGRGVAEGDATAIRVLARLIAHDEEEEVRQKAGTICDWLVLLLSSSKLDSDQFLQAGSFFWFPILAPSRKGRPPRIDPLLFCLAFVCRISLEGSFPDSDLLRTRRVLY